MSDGRGGSGLVERLPHPATKQDKGLPPHPATIVQPKRSWGVTAPRPPHPATVVQPRPAHTNLVVGLPAAVQRSKGVSAKQLVVTAGVYAGHYMEDEWDRLVDDLHAAKLTTVKDANNLKTNLGTPGMYVFESVDSLVTWTKKQKNANPPEPVTRNKQPNPSVIKGYDVIKESRYTVHRKKMAWLEYKWSFDDHFKLKKEVVTGASNASKDDEEKEDEKKESKEEKKKKVEATIQCVANVGDASNWLEAALGIKNAQNWAAIRSAGLKAFKGSHSASQLTHTGIMLAHVSTSKGDRMFVCGASNYHESLADTAEPWIYTRVAQKLGEGADMHTERFCLVELYDWIMEESLAPTGIEIVWVLEKEMCPKACVPVLGLFTEYWGAMNIKVGSKVVKDDSYFKKNVNVALKGFTLL